VLSVGTACTLRTRMHVHVQCSPVEFSLWGYAIVRKLPPCPVLVTQAMHGNPNYMLTYGNGKGRGECRMAYAPTGPTASISHTRSTSESLGRASDPSVSLFHFTVEGDDLDCVPGSSFLWFFVCGGDVVFAQGEEMLKESAVLH